MLITLNGQPKQLEDGATIAALVALVTAATARAGLVAVELNRTLVRRRDHAATPLHDGDAVELVTLVGGG